MSICKIAAMNRFLIWGKIKTHLEELSWRLGDASRTNANAEAERPPFQAAILDSRKFRKLNVHISAKIPSRSSGVCSPSSLSFRKSSSEPGDVSYLGICRFAGDEYSGNSELDAIFHSNVKQ